MGKTIEFYNDNPKKYVKRTKDISIVSDIRKLFKESVDRCIDNETPRVLDLGCGYGRDAHVFEKKWEWKVDARDGSEKMAEIGKKMFDLDIKVQKFLHLEEQNKYDAVWAMSSILHLPYHQLEPMMHKIIDSLKTCGVFYTSFIYDPSWMMAVDHQGRSFLCFTSDRLYSYIEDHFSDRFKNYNIKIFRNEHHFEKPGWISLILEVEKK